MLKPEIFVPSSSLPDAHARIAAQFGIELSYQTIWGEVRSALDSTIASLAAALIPPSLQWHDLSSCNSFLFELWHTAWQQLSPPSAVEETSQPFDAIYFHLSPAELMAPLDIHIVWENSAHSFLRLAPSQLQPLACAQIHPTIQIPPGTQTPPSIWTRVRINPAAVSDSGIAFVSGYHQLRIQSVARQATIAFTLTPSTVYRTPATNGDAQFTGVSCFLSAIRSSRNWGCGDFTDLTAWGRIAHTQGGFDFLALNPLHAISNRTPYNSSPYLPLSIFSRNFLYLDLEALPEFSAPGPQRLFHSAAIQSQLAELRTTPLLQIEEVARLKGLFLRILYREFRRSAQNKFGATLHQYRTEQGPSLLRFATYCAFSDYFHKRNPNCWHWRDWPLEYRQFHSPASLALAQRLSSNIDFYCYVQFRIESQLAEVQTQLRSSGMRLGLYHDLALATDRCAADLWAYQDLYVPAVRVGSPPDDFNEQGQDWGFPALNPLKQLHTSFDFFIRSLRRSGQHGAALRLDHVMRLARLYWIPDGATAKDGAYVRDYFLPMLRLIALESHRGQFEVVGEDLGTVPDYFRASLERFQFLSYKLLYFERSQQGFRQAADYSPNSLCSITTHDLPTLDGYWTHRDIELRQHLGYLSPSAKDQATLQRQADKKLLQALFESYGPFDLPTHQLDGPFSFLLRTPCRMILVNTEELFAEVEQQNFPGTTAEQPNWLRRWPVPLEQMPENIVFQARLASWNRARKQHRIQSLSQ